MRRLSLFLFLIFVFTVPWEKRPEPSAEARLDSLIGIVALVVALITCLLEGKVAKPSAFVFAFGVLVAWQLATYFWSVDPVSTLARTITMVQLLAMVWLVSELCTSERERLQMMQAFVVGCVVVCLVLIQAYLSGHSGGGFRYAPANFNPNESADMIAIGIPMALLVATSRSGGILRWLNLAYIPLGIFAVVLTASRSGFIATCLGL